ncbi:hypothetical protein L7F22_021917 [Adiantum nelumboides]|nr:hypothetical protein [Adiantum nelumboides]
MSQEGDKEMESGSSSEDALSPRSGKRWRDGKELRGSNSPGAGGNVSENQATSEENLINSQSGKRIKCDGASKPEGGSVSKKNQALTTAVEEETPFFCTVCSVTCTSKKDYNTHVAGKRHARAVMGVVTPRSAKVPKKLGVGSKAEVLPAIVHADVPMTQQPVADGSITIVDQAGKASCTGYIDMEGQDLQALRSPDKNGGKDMAVEQQELKEGIPMEWLGSQVLKTGSTCKVALHNTGNENLVQPLTNGYHVHNAFADGLGTSSNNTEGQNNKSILDSARCKSSSDGIARALAAAYQACPCPGFEGFLKSGTHDQAAGCVVPQAAGTVSSNMGMVSMHTHCFMNLLHDVQVKGIENLFLHVICDEKVRGFVMEPWLSNGAPVPALPSAVVKDLNCTVCRVEYGSKSDLDRHVAGRKHTSLVTRLHSRCQVCNVNCNSEREFEKHVNGKKHASKLRLAQKRVAF